MNLKEKSEKEEKQVIVKKKNITRLNLKKIIIPKGNARKVKGILKVSPSRINTLMRKETYREAELKREEKKIEQDNSFETSVSTVVEKKKIPKKKKGRVPRYAKTMLRLKGSLKL